MNLRFAPVLCALLVLCMLPLAASAAAAVDESKVIYPKAPAGAAESVAAGSNRALNGTTVLGALVLAGGGVWLLRRSRNAKATGRVSGALAIDETKPLGNRQYLVVASYEGKKFLLGVCPGRIDMLSPLDGSAAPAKSAR
ncbi:MAG: flagellar biosynthetic protein FliO [Undibacterium sp.]|nr:flagellar biosynthetic protein FliO [Opitutaceae bacterium]